jgi:hypothetical protein
VRFGERFIEGLQVQYLVDDRLLMVSHNYYMSPIMKMNQVTLGGPKKKPKKSLRIAEFEHIEAIVVEYNCEGLVSFYCKTNADQYLKALTSQSSPGMDKDPMVPDSIPGLFRRVINLRSQNKAAIGFRGLYTPPQILLDGKNEPGVIRDLFVYCAVRLDIVTNTSQQQESSPGRRNNPSHRRQSNAGEMRNRSNSGPSRNSSEIMRRAGSVAAR